MKIRHTGLFWNLIVVGAMFVVGPSAILASPSLISSEVKTPPSEPMPRDGVPVARLSEAYGKLPLVFESNQGQTAPEVKFLSRGSGYGLFLTPTEAVLTLTRASDAKADHAEATAVGMKLVGANAKPEMVGVDPLPGKSHYFIGKDPAQWHTNVPQYAKVRYKAVYSGIDLVYYGNQRQLEYDLVVAPGADPKKIALAFQGVKTIEIDTNGQLVLHTGAGDLIQHKPIVYQEIDGERKLLDGRYVLKGKQQVGFQVARYDRSKPLVIDPVLAYSTYLGGGGGIYSGDTGFSIAVDSAGNAYVTGQTFGLPTTDGAYDQVCGSPSGSFGEGGCVHILPSSDCAPCTTIYNPDAFVAKLNASGTALIYSTYLGGGLPYLGGNPEGGTSIAVDSTGNAYVTGQTRSADFPVTPGALRTTCGCGTYISDAFVTKLNPSGSALVYSTYLAGSSNDIGYGIALDGAGNAYVTGTTNSVDFPTVSAAQALAGGGNDAFVAKLNPTGTNLVYSTFLGGSGNDNGYGITLAVAGDGSVSAHVTGSTDSSDFPLQGAYQTVLGGGVDAFVTKLNAAGTAFDYSTYLGGNGNDYGFGIGLDSLASGWNVYVTGSTASTNFPTTDGAFTGAFASKLDLDAVNQLVYSTNPGGSSGNAIAVTGAGNAYVAGANGYDAFVTQLDAAGTSQVYTFALGSSGVDAAYGVAVDGSGSAYVTGSTAYTDFPTTPGAVQPSYGGGASDIFVSKIADASAVRFSAATYSASESAGSVTLTVERIGSSSGVFSVDYATADGSALATSDYTATNGTVTFNDGDMTPKSIVVPVTNDTAEELNETFTVTLSNPVGGYLNNPATATVTITNDDTWARLQFSAASYTKEESGGSATITVTRTTSSTGAVSVNYATSNGTATAGSDYTATSGTINFADGDMTPKTFIVPIISDSVEEADETVTITLSSPTGPVFLGTPSSATLTITNDDETLHFNAGGYSVAEEGGSATITVTRTGAISTYGVTVDYATSDGSAQAGSDYTTTTGTLVFGAGVATQSFSVPIVNTDDGQAGAGEPYETVTLTLSNPTGGGPDHGVNIGSPNPGTLTIVDNDPSDQPTISNIAAGNITSNSARITWTTNQTSDSDVEYGTSTAYGAHVYAPSSATSHSVNLTGLAYSTTYHYRVKSRNASGQLAISADLTFVTASLPPPSVTSVSLPSVTYGVTANSSVTIYGSNFVLGATITVGSLTGTTVAGSAASASTPFVFTSSTQVKFWWPNTSLAPGAYDVVVTNPDTASATLTNGFTVVSPQPAISSVAANSVTYGVTSSSQVTIFGANFALGATITVGSLSGVTVSGSSATATVPYVYVSSTSLKFWWPNTSLPPGAYTVTVTNPTAAGGLSANLASGFAVAAPQPTITSLSTSSVTYGVTANASITINGSSFVLGATITVGGLSGQTVSGSLASATTPYVFVSSTQLKFWWPNTSLAPGVYTVQVVNPTAAGGLGTNLVGGFTVAAPQPTITSLSTSSVTYGVTANASITIYGSSFVLGATITVGGLSGQTVSGSLASATTPYVFVSSTQVKFWWPNTSLGPNAYTVTVTNPAAAGGLGGSLASGFTVNAPQPTVTSTSPNPVTYGITSNSSVTIYGSNFVLGATITVGSLTGTTVAGSTASAATPFVHVSSGQLKFWWPNTSLPTGPYTVQVTNSPAAGGLSASLASGFTVNAPQPTVTSTSLNPVTYGVTSSRSITITGTNFVLGATITVGSLSGVTVSGSSATATTPFVFTNSGSLKFWWPNTSLPVGSYTVTVTEPAPAGGLTGSLANGFTVQ